MNALRNMNFYSFVFTIFIFGVSFPLTESLGGTVEEARTAEKWKAAGEMAALHREKVAKIICDQSPDSPECKQASDKVKEDVQQADKNNQAIKEVNEHTEKSGTSDQAKQGAESSSNQKQGGEASTKPVAQPEKSLIERAQEVAGKAQEVLTQTQERIEAAKNPPVPDLSKVPESISQEHQTARLAAENEANRANAGKGTPKSPEKTMSDYQSQIQEANKKALSQLEPLRGTTEVDKAIKDIKTYGQAVDDSSGYALNKMKNIAELNDGWVKVGFTDVSRYDGPAGGVNDPNMGGQAYGKPISTGATKPITGSGNSIPMTNPTAISNSPSAASGTATISAPKSDLKIPVLGTAPNSVGATLSVPQQQATAYTNNVLKTGLATAQNLNQSVVTVSGSNLPYSGIVDTQFGPSHRWGTGAQSIFYIEPAKVNSGASSGYFIPARVLSELAKF